MSFKSWLARRYIVNTLIPFIVQQGFKFKWMQRYRTIVGAGLILVGLMAGALAQTPIPPDVVASLHLAFILHWAPLAGTYLGIIGARFKDDPLPPAA
jgi:hypothetical protein